VLQRHPHRPLPYLRAVPHGCVHIPILTYFGASGNPAAIHIPGQGFLTSDGTLYSVTVSDLGVIQVEAFEVQLVGFEGSGR